jgi:fatty acid desaturase
MASTLFLDARKLKELQQLQSWRTAAAIAFDWAVIAAAITISQWASVWYVWLASIVVIAGRMHGLASLVHEFAHYRFVHNKRVNDWVGDILTAWPLLVTVSSYRNNHLQHHQHANTEKDPDYMVKVGKPRFTFPQKVHNLVIHILGYLIGANAYADMKTGLNRLNKKDAQPRNYIIARMSFYVGVLALMWAIDGMDELLIYWLVPYGTLFFTIMYVRSVAEHFAIDDIDNKLEGTRTVIPHFWERAFFGPHEVSYHLEHHLYAAVPFYNLPKLHAELMKNPDYRAKAHITRGYTTGLLREALAHGQRTLLKQRPASVGAEAATAG